MERLSTLGATSGVEVRNGLVTMDIPVDVIVVGFPRVAAERLAASLQPQLMAHQPYNYPRNGSTAGFAPGLFAPRAVFQVGYAPQSVADAYRAAFHTGAADVFADGNAAEDWLRQALAGAGFIADPARPALVLLHQGSDSNGYFYEYGNGTAAPVRAFGQGDLLVLDLSAETDPWVGATEPAYAAPVALDDPELDEKLRSAAADATAFRLLQGPLYLPSVKRCHGVTVLAARRETAIDGWPGYPLDPQQLQRAFEQLTGDPVFVDVKDIALPGDDPQLDLFTRLLNGAVSIEADVLTREWIEDNWSKYYVPHDGCEEYLTLVVSGDATDVQGRGSATYEYGNGHRFAYAMATSLCPLLRDLPVQVIGNCLSRDGIRDYRFPNMLVTHEAGHLFGLRHPHDVTSAEDGNSTVNLAFSSLATAMSYELDDRVLGFGAIDANNLRRNRAATALWMAERAGHAGSTQFSAALQAMQQYRWFDAGDALRDLDLTQPADPDPVSPPGSGFDGRCAAMPAGTEVTYVERATCPQCSVRDAGLAADGDLETFATLTSSSLRGGGVLRAKAPEGVVFDAGDVAGVYLDRSLWAAQQIYVRTYLDGQRQSENYTTGAQGTAGKFFYGYPTEQPFDEIELDVTFVPGSDVRILEFCSHGSR